MNTIVKALKGLYVKFGGSAADVKTVDTTAEMIDKVTSVASSGGGSSLPDMSGQSGRYLTNNGTAASWGEVSALPSMAEQSGKFLTNNGTTASWGSPTVDSSITEDGANPVTGAAIFTELAGKASNADVPLVLHGTFGMNGEQPIVTITDETTVADIYADIAGGRTVFLDIAMSENTKLRANVVSYVPISEGVYAVTFGVAMTSYDGDQQKTVMAVYGVIFSSGLVGNAYVYEATQ